MESTLPTQSVQSTQNTENGQKQDSTLNVLKPSFAESFRNRSISPQPRSFINPSNLQSRDKSDEIQETLTSRVTDMNPSSSFGRDKVVDKAAPNQNMALDTLGNGIPSKNRYSFSYIYSFCECIVGFKRSY